MARKMAALYKTEYVPEVAREIITSNNFTVEDIILIGKAQTERILEKTRSANRILFCDSDLITTQIYSETYLKKIPEVLFELEKQVPMDYYFLFDIDVPWVSDGLRDLGGRREEMMMIFKNKLSERGLPYTLVSGPYGQREKEISTRVNGILANS
jgi:HTH-type transcriptional regulator, transcriptional repressor of NAD biosynthesis genes